MIRTLFAAAVAVTLVGFATAADLKSGPQTGDKIPGPFAPLNINGKSAGEKHCLFCDNGDNPVVMIFARTTECPGTQKLLKAVDAATAAHSKCEMGSFVVFCTDEEKAEDKLKDLAKKEGYKKIVLSVDTPAGPSKYKVAKEADITVVLYTSRVAKANYAFEKGKITDKDIEAIVADVSKIVPAK